MSGQGDVWTEVIASAESGHCPRSLKVVGIATNFMAEEKERRCDLLTVPGLGARNPYSPIHSAQQPI